jgi:hypothetical protein
MASYSSRPLHGLRGAVLCGLGGAEGARGRPTTIVFLFGLNPLFDVLPSHSVVDAVGRLILVHSDVALVYIPLHS